MEPDRLVIEVASWRLAAELMRRHPGAARLLRGHPGGGQYDLLWLLLDALGREIRLNRAGTIQVSSSVGSPWSPVAWDEFLATDLAEFVLRVERAVGWDSPARGRPVTPVTLTYRVIAELVAHLVGAGRRVVVEQGYVATSGYGGGPNPVLSSFGFPAELLARRADDLFGEPGYRFWIPMVDGAPVMAVEQGSATAFLVGGDTVDVWSAYRAAGNRLGPVVASLNAGVP